jgi:hypothetical protein
MMNLATQNQAMEGAVVDREMIGGNPLDSIVRLR